MISTAAGHSLNPSNPRNPWVAAAVAVFVILGIPLQAQSADSLRSLVPADYNRVRGIQDIQSSPDGRRVLLQIGAVDAMKDEFTSDLWLLDPATGNLRQLTHGEGSEYHGRFSPDGRRVAYLASRDDQVQVHVIPVEGGRRQRSSHLKAT